MDKPSTSLHLAIPDLEEAAFLPVDAHVVHKRASHQPTYSQTSSTNGALALGSVHPPRYLRAPKGEIDYASAMPDEVLHRILTFVDIDTGVASTISSQRWRPLFDERICQAHCERIYLDQAHVKRLNPARFQGSWKAMLQTRPRVRTNGFYFLLSSYIKKPIKDMWTEITPGTILEVRYYRYVRFLPGGRLVYALLYLPPAEAVSLFKEYDAHASTLPPSTLNSTSSSSFLRSWGPPRRDRIRESGRSASINTTGNPPISANSKKKELYEGLFWTHKGSVICEIQTPYSRIHFRFKILAREGGLEGGREGEHEGGRGKFTALMMEEHTSVALNDSTGTPIPHKPAHAPLLFYKVPVW